MEWVGKEEISAELIAGGENGREEEDEEEEGGWEREGRHGEGRGFPFGEEKGGGFERRGRERYELWGEERWRLERGEDLGVREGGGSMSDWGFFVCCLFFGGFGRWVLVSRRWVLVIRLVVTRINGGIEKSVWFE